MELEAGSAGGGEEGGGRGGGADTAGMEPGASHQAPGYMQCLMDLTQGGLGGSGITRH